MGWKKGGIIGAVIVFIITLILFIIDLFGFGILGPMDLFQKFSFWMLFGGGEGWEAIFFVGPLINIILGFIIGAIIGKLKYK